MVVSYFWQHKGWRQFGKVEASFLNNWNPFHSPQILWLYLDATIKVFLESRNEFSFFFFFDVKDKCRSYFFRCLFYFSTGNLYPGKWWITKWPENARTDPLSLSYERHLTPRGACLHGNPCEEAPSTRMLVPDDCLVYSSASTIFLLWMLVLQKSPLKTGSVQWVTGFSNQFILISSFTLLFNRIGSWEVRTH